jgi:hypothetical protein
MSLNGQRIRIGNWLLGVIFCRSQPSAYRQFNFFESNGSKKFKANPLPFHIRTIFRKQSLSGMSDLLKQAVASGTEQTHKLLHVLSVSFGTI